ncbi:hypothetical protein HO173_002918 [Letharia columbiana]|uniref:Uncharacterized protein n=1 Tax=Letharia columbiana TaxID=112416 RepID=A0A8H6G1X7_9LECA|nr:uncharacterized protein HO173_002918 [Letharia columbiana]KAF6239046.1 hypothetical protein HO173_002918 [Letharia columbiana]
MPSKRIVQTVMTNSILNLSAGSSVDAPGLPSQSESLNQAIMLSYVQASTHHHLRSAYLGLCARQQFDLPVISHYTASSPPYNPRTLNDCHRPFKQFLSID